MERGVCQTRERAKALIMSNAVIVDDICINKAGELVFANANIRIRGDDNPYVSRGGLKLKSALKFFDIKVHGMVILDVGASTGGFTDCLLQEGAKKVYALDVGYGQLAWKLREDKRVITIERTNIRYFEGAGIEDAIDMATIDVSFISLKLVIPAVLRLVKKKDFKILALIKPQFEAGPKEVEKKGVVRNPDTHIKVIEEIKNFSLGIGLNYKDIFESPLTGPKGNKEFFIYLTD